MKSQQEGYAKWYAEYELIVFHVMFQLEAREMILQTAQILLLKFGLFF